MAARKPDDVARTLASLLTAQPPAEPDDAGAALLDCDQTLLALDEGFTRLVNADLDELLTHPDVSAEKVRELDTLFGSAYHLLRGMRRASRSGVTGAAWCRRRYRAMSSTVAIVTTCGASKGELVAVASHTHSGQSGCSWRAMRSASAHPARLRSSGR